MPNPIQLLSPKPSPAIDARSKAEPASNAFADLLGEAAAQEDAASRISGDAPGAGESAAGRTAEPTARARRKAAEAREADGDSAQAAGQAETPAAAEASPLDPATGLLDVDILVSTPVPAPQIDPEPPAGAPAGDVATATAPDVAGVSRPASPVEAAIAWPLEKPAVIPSRPAPAAPAAPEAAGPVDPPDSAPGPGTVLPDTQGATPNTEPAADTTQNESADAGTPPIATPETPPSLRPRKTAPQSRGEHAERLRESAAHLFGIPGREKPPPESGTPMTAAAKPAHHAPTAPGSVPNPSADPAVASAADPAATPAATAAAATDPATISGASAAAAAELDLTEPGGQTSGTSTPSPASPAALVAAPGTQVERAATPPDNRAIADVVGPARFERLLDQLNGEIRSGKDQFQLTIDPPDLGRLDVRIVAHGDGVVVRFVAERNDVAQWLRQDAPALQLAVEKDGLRVLDVEVRSRLDLDAGAQGRGGEPERTSYSERFAPTPAAKPRGAAFAALAAPPSSGIDLLV